MRKMWNVTLLLLAVALFTAPRPATADSYQITTDSLYRHLQVLTADSLEGRETGEPGEWKAAQYIAGQFESFGLIPHGDDGAWFQAFDFVKKIDLGPANSLTVNDVDLVLEEEFRPMVQSGNVSFDFDEVIPVGYGITFDSGGYDDYDGIDVAGNAVLVKRFVPLDADSTLDFESRSSLADKVINALDHKAAGVFFITPSDQDDTMMTGGFTHVTPKDIPIMFLRRKATERLGIDLDHPQPLAATGEIELVRVRDTGYNVVGYLPSGNDTTIILGAHYDHLGWGGPGSRYRGEEKKIHSGADDNGSGTAALLELARKYNVQRDQLKHSLVFIAFSGEEKGILGSSFYARNMSVDPDAIRMMINLDMIGRLKDQEKGLAIMGTGTCPEFKTYFDSLPSPDVKLAYKESGMGPSDHTAFYNQDIPVLFFFTGAHEDYHKPEDVIEKIDFEGIRKVTEIVDGVVTRFDRFDGALVFKKTKSEQSGTTRRQFSVTLGIMPDFITEVKGLRVDGVSAERPAERAGVQSGDVIMKMGTFAIDDIYTYMNCLGKFRKGDTTEIVVQRGTDTLNLQVIFQ